MYWNDIQPSELNFSRPGAITSPSTFTTVEPLHGPLNVTCPTKNVPFGINTCPTPSEAHAPFQAFTKAYILITTKIITIAFDCTTKIFLKMKVQFNMIYIFYKFINVGYLSPQ